LLVLDFRRAILFTIEIFQCEREKVFYNTNKPFGNVLCKDLKGIYRMDNNVKILVATHKEYKMPLSDMYIPIHVGKQGKPQIGYVGDNTGDHISHKNANYCELTALYWAWKNLECDYIGLSHYRRYFSNGNRMELRPFGERKDKFSSILTEETVKKELSKYDVILPQKRNYYIESVWRHYANAHYEDDLIAVKNIISKRYPDYMDSFTYIMNGKKLHLFNMFVMKKSLFDEYAEWVFNILFELEEKVCIKDYSQYQARIFGFISERLFNVWIHHNQLRIKELNIIHMENENKLKKHCNFIKRKMKGNSNGFN